MELEMEKNMIEILATLGPACCEIEILREMFQEGMTGIRLNLSHTTLDDSKQWIWNYHQAAAKEGICPELLIDLEGPELRIGQLEENLYLAEEEAWKLVSDQMNREPDSDQTEVEDTGIVSLKAWKKQHQLPVVGRIPIPEQVLDALEPDNDILIDDGKLQLRVLHKNENGCRAIVLRGGTLSGRKSIKIVGKHIQGDGLTDKDRTQIACARKYGVTAVMEPFVTSKEQLMEVRKSLEEYQLSDFRIFSKIENQLGIERLEEIIPESDMIVIARGDLGNDMPLWDLPAAQQQIADRCNEFRAPYLVVTQMLASMVDHPVPTRAEVSDIYHAVQQGASAVMVTNETAVGNYPVDVIRYLSKTAGGK